VRFEVDAPAVLPVIECNCSMCRMTGYQHLIVPASRFRLLQGADALSEYTFNTGTAHHLFCRHCGIKSFYVPRSHPDGFSVNARCLDADTVEGIQVSLFDDNNRDVETAAIAHLTHDADEPADPTPAVRIGDFEPRWREDFARLNVEWLDRWFTVEPVDREVLGNTEAHILADGGHILFAIASDAAGHERAVGTVALKHEGEGVYELTKMAVAPDQRGSGVGRKLMAEALATFQRLGGRELFLESSSKLGPALKLYESVGFRHYPAPRPGSHYARADVYMVWEP
jgi:ribosomal protein S18 acetylase RimI-like enzyme